MQWSNTVMSKPLQVKTYIYQWSHFSLVIQFPHILQVLHHKRRMRMILKVGLRDGNRELGAFRGVTRLVVDGNQGRGDVCAFPFDIRSQWYLPKLRIIPNNPEAEDICVIRTRYFYFLSINTVVNCPSTECPKKTHFQNYHPASWHLRETRFKTLSLISEVLACRMMILKVRFLGHPVDDPCI